MNSLGERIRSARESAGFTQEKLAERAGVSRSAVARWETNDIEPNLNHLVLLSKTLNVSTDFLLGVNRHVQVAGLSENAVCALKCFIDEIKKSE